MIDMIYIIDIIHIIDIIDMIDMIYIIYMIDMIDMIYMIYIMYIIYIIYIIYMIYMIYIIYMIYMIDMIYMIYIMYIIYIIYMIYMIYIIYIIYIIYTTTDTPGGQTDTQRLYTNTIDILCITNIMIITYRHTWRYRQTDRQVVSPRGAGLGASPGRLGGPGGRRRCWSRPAGAVSAAGRAWGTPRGGCLHTCHNLDQDQERPDPHENQDQNHITT